MSDTFLYKFYEYAAKFSIFKHDAVVTTYSYNSTAIRRPFDCLSKVIKVTVT